jgi:hypothetical protein
MVAMKGWKMTVWSTRSTSKTEFHIGLYPVSQQMTSSEVTPDARERTARQRANGPPN